MLSLSSVCMHLSVVGAIFEKNILQGSVATPFRCGGICNAFYCKFQVEYISKSILKIGQWLTKI